MALFSTACALSCADADPLNMSVAAAASMNNFLIATFSSNADYKARPERPLGPSSQNRIRGRLVSNSKIPLWFRGLQIAFD
jgi:hypothetical protein